MGDASIRVFLFNVYFGIMLATRCLLDKITTICYFYTFYDVYRVFQIH